jgi:hypothetical protein
MVYASVMFEKWPSKGIEFFKYMHTVNLVCHGMVPITFYASVRISTVFAEFALKTSVEISTN